MKIKKAVSAVLAAVLLVGTLAGATGCKKNKYPPVESTAEERRVVLTLSDGENEYEARYELYRALYLTYHAETGGEELHARVLRRIAEIYAAFAVARTVGYDGWSEEADEAVAAAVVSSVEGGDGVGGFGGDYDAYLASLKELNLNYSVSDLLLRYSLCYDAILAAYSDPERLGDEGIAAQRAAARAYYDSDESVLVLIATLNGEYFSAERARQIRDAIAEKENAQAVRNYILGFTATASYDANVGALIGRYSMDEAIFGELTEAAFSLEVGETSAPILISDGNIAPQYYILYCVEKSDEFAGEYADAILSGYRDDEIGRALARERDALLAGAVESDFLKGLDRESIRMD